MVELQIYGAVSVFLFENQTHVAGGFAHYVHRGTLAAGNPANKIQIFFIHQQSHSFLAFVSDYFFGRESGVAYGQFIHFNEASGGFHQFRKAVQMPACSVIVYGDNRVLIGFGQSPDYIGHPFLHFRVGSLHCVQFYSVGEFPCVHRRNCSSAHPDAVIVSTQHYYFLSCMGSFFQRIFFVGIAHSSGQHDDLVVGVFFLILFVFEGQQRSADQGLAKFVTEIAGSV